MWGQVGIYKGNMLFWKDAITYQFLEPYDNPKKLEAAYQKHRKELLEDSGIITTEAPEHPMSLLVLEPSWVLCQRPVCAVQWIGGKQR